ncbi:hypothetical protein TBLA_0E02390 [Henningerozyma blattae CBS 6284]|uniref:Uncharacterized protein n=1 Tax=Henningerozyma blattae (strain ATCC 34711 / CBS 6284 / DSM 70876 / NBRC 10599 / NRRL Y-10934 / UCD 77-7) TaxID=1071380 RepID=I2H4J2_HENB6|nr:hypothetical protein TBLA_0E02390 [Tetrapisispora blattae CBS 6284]CCH61294.1 hypothetical protein TBLA_0E02390 [Tetrapisispora blattae CBS 6284]
MASGVATIQISKNVVLPILLYINRSQLLKNNSSSSYSSSTNDDNLFQAPIISNNSIICLKSANTKLYLSNIDMKNLIEEIRDDILLIIYEITSIEIIETVLNKVRIGNTIDFKSSVLPVLFPNGDPSNFVDSNITTITRVGKYKYKLNFKKNWELDIYIENIKKLQAIRYYILFGSYQNSTHATNIYQQRRILLAEKYNVDENNGTPIISVEPADESIPISEDPVLVQEDEEDKKPQIAFKYNPVTNLGGCLSIHVLQRPKRKHYILKK